MDEFFLDCDPSCFPEDFPEVHQDHEKSFAEKYPGVRPLKDLFVKIGRYEEGIARQATQSSHQKIVVPMLVPKRLNRPLEERKMDRESVSLYISVVFASKYDFSCFRLHLTPMSLKKDEALLIGLFKPF